MEELNFPAQIHVIYTHLGPDLDACFAVWALLRLHLGAKNAEVRFRPAYWDGAEMGPNDVAVDMEAGGRGWKGEKSGDVVHSASASIIGKYASKEQKRALGPVVDFIDIQDSRGSVVQRLAPGLEKKTKYMLSAVSLTRVWQAFQEKFLGDDALVFSRMCDIFDGYLLIGDSFQHALKAATAAEFVGKDRKVAIHRGSGQAVHGLLFGRGVLVVVSVDGLNIGIHCARDFQKRLRMDHPRLRAVVEAAGEKVGNGEGVWFAHLGGWFFCRGTRPKAPATSPSKVDPRELARVAAELVDELPATS